MFGVGPNTRKDISVAGEVLREMTLLLLVELLSSKHLCYFPLFTPGPEKTTEKKTVGEVH